MHYVYFKVKYYKKSCKIKFFMENLTFHSCEQFLKSPPKPVLSAFTPSNPQYK